MSGVLHQAIARVLRSGAGNAQPDQPIVVGTGVLVSTPQLGPCLLTCAHVVNSAFGWRQGATQAPGKEQVLFFDLPAKGIVYKTELAVWTPPLMGRDRTDHPACDLALLKLLPGQSLPGDLRLHRPQDFKVLDDTVLVGQQLHSFGFSRDAGSHVSGMAQGTDASGWLHLEGSTDTEEFVAPGFSGAPVFDAARRFILGLVVSLDEDGNRAFLQSVANIQRAIPELARPYRGLKAFEEEDAEFFFGREAFVGQMLAKMPKYPLIGVTGASGAGKSSAIRAGVIPRLRTDRSNIILIMRPGDDPWKALAKTLMAQTQKDGDILDRADRISDMAERLRTKFGALKDYAAALLDEAGAGRLVIFVDQFEELFSLAGHERSVPLTGKKLDDFRDLMVATATLDDQKQIQWLFSLRGDFVDRAFRPPDFVELMDDGNIILPDLKSEELRAAIKEPAAKLYVEFEKGTQDYPGLVERIARDAGETAGALPLMQHVLELLWRDMALRRTEDDAFVHELTHAAYDRLGGLPGALDRHAEEVYTGLEPAEQELMPRLFSRLVNVKEDGEATRRIARRSELRKAPELDKDSTSGEEMWRLAAKLAGEDFRLLVLRSGSEPDVTLPGHQASQEIETDDQTVEVAHEALLRNWVRLQGWIRNDRRFLLWRQRLGLLIKEHDDPQVRGSLLSGGPLETARSFLATKGHDLSKTEIAFIKKSTEEEDKFKRQKRRLVSAIIIILLSAALLSSTLLYFQRVTAHQLLETTYRLEESIVKLVLQSEETSKAKSEADEKARLAVSNETKALAALSKIDLAEGRPVDALKLALAAWPRNAADQRLRFDVALERISAPIASSTIPKSASMHSDSVWGVLPTPDGRYLSWSFDHTLRLSDPDTGKQVGPLMQHDGPIHGAFIMPDGRILSWSDDKTLRLWNASTNQQMGPSMVHGGSVMGVLAMTGNRVLSRSKGTFSSSDDKLRIWNTDTGQQIGQSMNHDSSIVGALVMPDGRILSWSFDNTLRLWDSATGLQQGSSMEHDDYVMGALLMPNGQILSWSQDKSLRIWDPDTGLQRGLPMEHDDDVSGALLLPDDRILSWSEDNTLRLWNAATNQQIGPPMRHDGRIGGALIMPDNRILSWSGDKTLRLWDAATGRQISATMQHDEGVDGARVIPNGNVLSWSSDKTLRLWDASTGQQIGPSMKHDAAVKGARVMVDGRILSWSSDNTLRLWDSATGQQLGPFMQHGNSLDGVLLASDGRIVTWHDDNTLQLWDADAGRQKGHSMKQEAGVNGALLTPDARILSWSDDGALQLWNASTGQQSGRPMKHDRSVTKALVMPDGRILSWSNEWALQLWDITTGRPSGPPMRHGSWIKGALVMTDGRILSWSSDNSLMLWSTTGEAEQYMYHDQYVTGALVMPDGYILSWSVDETLQLWDPATGERSGRSVQHDGPVTGALVMPNGYILSWSSDNTLRQWNAATGQQVGPSMKHDDAVKSAIVVPGGRIVSWSEDGTLRLWDANTNRQLGLPMSHEKPVNDVRLMPDGRILSWSEDGTLRFWDASTNQQLGPAMRHDDSVTGALLLRNDRILSWSRDSTLRLWDASTGQQIGPPMKHTEAVNGALMMPDGRVLSWSVDGTLRFWNITWPAGNMFEIACALLQPNFSLTDVVNRHELTIQDEICANPAGIPLPNTRETSAEQQPVN